MKGKKTGGRVKGSKNKVTLFTEAALSPSFKDFFRDVKFSCPEEWFNIYEALRNAPEQLLYMDIRVKVLERITLMIHGKPKENSEPVAVPPPPQFAQLPDQTVIDVILPNAVNA